MFGESRKHKVLEDVEENCKEKNNETGASSGTLAFLREKMQRDKETGEKRGREKIRHLDREII